MSRARVWTFITYPESLPTDFIEILGGDTDPPHDIGNVPFVMSPIHDKDIAEEGKGWNGTPYKKPHYHNMVMFTNVKSYKQVIDMVKVMGAGHVAQVHSTQAMVRYFIHADQKEKAQYNKDDIKTFNGADLDNLFEKNDKEIYGIVGDIIKLIDDNDIKEYSHFIKICMMEEYFTDYFPLAVGKYQFFFLNYIKSKRFSHN